MLVIMMAATAAISLTVTKSTLFEPLRDWLEGRSPFLGKLVSCPWCFSHWVAAALHLLNGGPKGVAFVIYVMATVTGSAIFVGLILRAMKEVD